MSGLRPLEVAAKPLAGLSSALFAALSAARGKRFFHPTGVGFAGQVTFRATTFDLPFVGKHRALARISRGIGMPESAPDVLGLAIKVPDLGQDLLLVTSGRATVTRHLLLPTRSFFSLSYSSVLPYELDDVLMVLGANPDSALGETPVRRMDDLRPLVALGRLRFDLTVARVGRRAHEVFGSLVLEDFHAEEVAFNPWNSHARLRPAGALNELRQKSYERSQRARPDAQGSEPGKLSQ